MPYLGEIFEKLDETFQKDNELFIYKLIVECKDKNIFIIDSYYGASQLKYIINEFVNKVEKELNFKIYKNNFKAIDEFLEFNNKDEGIKDTTYSKIYEMEFKLKNDNNFSPESINFWVCQLDGDDEHHRNTTSTLKRTIDFLNSNMSLDEFIIDEYEDYEIELFKKYNIR